MTLKKYCTICNEWYFGEVCPTCEARLKSMPDKNEEKLEQKKKKKDKPKRLRDLQRQHSQEDQHNLDAMIQKLIDKYKA